MKLDYIATADIVPVDFIVTGDDVAFTGNAITSVATNLSGLLSGQWVSVVGSVSNDGWYQLSADSVVGSMTVVQSLVAESAGALLTLDGYLHGYGEAYSIIVACEVLDSKFDDSFKANSPLDRSGETEIVFFGTDEVWSVVTDEFDFEDVPSYKEFRASTVDGQTFSFDPYGDGVVSVDLMSVEIKSRLQFRRVNTTMKMTAAFSVRKVS